jgi:hypothetical protein
LQEWMSGVKVYLYDVALHWVCDRVILCVKICAFPGLKIETWGIQLVKLRGD